MLWIAVVAVVLGTPILATAQEIGEISGSTRDQTGAALPGARVILRGATDQEGRSGPAGDFAFRSLPDGDYELSAEFDGFAPARRTVRVQSGQRVTVTLTLGIANLEETIVTAAKAGGRDAQTLPMAVTAVPGAQIASFGLQNVGDAAAFAPSVTMSQIVGLGQLTIRGIGASALYAGSDPSSAMYLDGVYLARPAMVFERFLDVERVEVLRGPQGTLYGRNAVGGAMNLITRQPTNDFQAATTLTTGNFGEYRADARVSGPIKRDRAMGSFAFTRAVRDGYVRDLEHPDHPLGGDDAAAARGQLRLVFDRRTSLLLSSDVDRQGGTPLNFSKVIARKPGFQFDNPPDLHDVRTSVEAWNRTVHYGASARLTTELTPSISLVSLTAYRDLNYEFLVDADSTELDLLTTLQHDRQHQLSEEITISYQRPGLTWVGGAFLFQEDDHQTFWVDQPAAGVQVQLDPRVEAASRALFGQATIGLTSRLSATAGIRYTHETKNIDNAGGRYRLEPPHDAVPGSVYGYADAISHRAWTPKLGLEIRLPREALGYISATRGFKSGGFNLSSTVPGRGYAPEWVWSFESGVKGALANGRSRFGVSVFHAEYSNLQVQTPIGIGVFDIRNAAAANISGVEVENTSRLGRGFEAGGHFTWLDATYERYIAVSNSGAVGDVAGNRLNNAPEWAGRLWVEWSRELARSRRLAVAVNSSAQSTVFYTPFNDRIQQQVPYGLLGGRVEYGPSHGRWAVGAYARNLTNTDYVTGTFGTPPNAFGGRPGPSRQFSVDFTIRR